MTVWTLDLVIRPHVVAQIGMVVWCGQALSVSTFGKIRLAIIKERQWPYRRTLLIYQSILFPVQDFTKQISMYFLWLKSFTVTFHYELDTFWPWKVKGRFLLKSTHWVNRSAQFSFFEKDIILTKPFQPTRADISCHSLKKISLCRTFSQWMGFRYFHQNYILTCS